MQNPGENPDILWNGVPRSGLAHNVPNTGIDWEEKNTAIYEQLREAFANSFFDKYI